MEELINEPKTKKGQITFEKLCDGADELFYVKGYHETSVSDITKRAGVAAGTFYVYFKDKLSIYKYLLLQYSKEIRRTIRNATQNSATRFEAEKTGMRVFLEYTLKKPRAYNIIWNSIYIDKQLFVHYYENFSEHYQRGIVNAQQKGEMSQGSPEIIAYLLMGIVNFLGLKYGVFEETQDFDEIVDTTMRLLKDGLFN